MEITSKLILLQILLLRFGNTGLGATLDSLPSLEPPERVRATVNSNEVNLLWDPSGKVNVPVANSSSPSQPPLESNSSNFTMNSTSNGVNITHLLQSYRIEVYLASDVSLVTEQVVVDGEPLVATFENLLNGMMYIVELTTKDTFNRTSDAVVLRINPEGIATQTFYALCFQLIM